MIRIVIAVLFCGVCSNFVFASQILFNEENYFEASVNQSLSFESFDTQFSERSTLVETDFSVTTNNGVLFHRQGSPNSFFIADGTGGLGYFNYENSLLSINFNSPINAVSFYLTTRSVGAMTLNGNSSFTTQTLELMPFFVGFISDSLFASLSFSFDFNTTNVSNRNYYLDALSYGSIDSTNLDFTAPSTAFSPIPLRGPATPPVTPSIPPANHVSAPSMLLLSLLITFIFFYRRKVR